MEYGGYHSIELGHKENEFFKGYSYIKLNSGRAAILFAAMESNARKVYIPYYNCNVVADILKQNGVCIEYYYLDSRMEPDVKAISSDELIVIVNYFGNKGKEELERLRDKYSNVVFDNTQAFFSEPITHCFNVYSCRKFFGVTDGAFLVREKGYEYSVPNDFQRDESWYRAAYLLKAVEVGTNGAYADNLEAEKKIGNSIKRMSLLTEKILESIDYNDIIYRRIRNVSFLKEKIDTINEMPVQIKNVPLIGYPLVIENDRFREYLIKNKIYTPQWWKYLMGIVEEKSIEYYLTRYLTIIPVDQRYDLSDMEVISDIIMSFER